MRSPCVGHDVAMVVLDGVEAEHLEFALLVAGHDVEPPAAAADVVDGRAELGEMQRVPAVQDVHGRDEQDALGERCEPGRDDQRIGRHLAELHLPAVAALAQPLRKAEHEVEAQFLGTNGAPGVVVEGPAGVPGSRRRAPGTRLDG